MAESRDKWSSHNEPFNRAYNGRVQYSAHASQLETQRIDDSVDFSSTGRRMADRYLTYTQQGQHVELKSYPSQHVPREVANYRVGSAQENAVFAISETNHACGTTEHGCHLSMPVPWCQEGNFPYQQPSPFYSRQQPEADIGSSSHHQNRNGSNNNFIADPSVAANDEPCSTYNTLDGSQDTHHPKQTQVWAEQNILEATYSMFTHDDPGSVYPNHNGLETPISNVLPENCPYSFQPSAPMYRMNIPTSSRRTSSKSPLGRAHAPASKLSPSYNRENSAGRVPSLSKTGGHGNSYHSHQGRRLAPPMQRCVSSASSQNTEATSSSARSDHTLEVLTCPVATCGAAFSGKFQKGNKKRHMRAKHSGNKQIKCRDCSRSFGRSDALLKHSRKQHPKGAADILPKSCSKGTSLRDEY